MNVLSYDKIIDPSLRDVFLNKFEYDANYDEHTRVIFNKDSYHFLDNPIVSNNFREEYGATSYYEGHPFVLNLTHDVDDIYPPFTHFLLSTLRFYKNPDNLGKLVRWKMGLSKSPYKNLREISKIEEKYGAKSTFFILPSEHDFRRKRYNLSDISDDVNYLLDEKFEIGLHTPYYSFNNVEAIRRDKALLEKEFKIEIKGCRNHYLRFKIPDSWDILESVGFEYDTTYGLNESIGFRNGVSHPFYPYNLNEQSQKRIIELPLHIMDTALFTRMSIDVGSVWSRVKQVIDCVENNGGVVTVLFHNSWFNSFMQRDILSLYEKILSYCSEKNAWITDSRNLVEWIKKSN
jgi:peptidoglycan/xylan/chitin deacetylase (PgdA/CDA1 family)